MAVIKQTIRYNMDDIDEMADLIYQRNVLKDSMQEVLASDPSKIAPLSRELRNINMRIQELINIDKKSENEEEDEDIFSLASVTPIAGGE